MGACDIGGWIVRVRGIWSCIEWLKGEHYGMDKPRFSNIEVTDWEPFLFSFLFRRGRIWKGTRNINTIFKALYLA